MIDSPRGYPYPMNVLVLLLLILAAVCFTLATFGVAARISWLGAGLLCLTLHWLVPALAATL